MKEDGRNPMLVVETQGDIQLEKGKEEVAILQVQKRENLRREE